MDKKTKLLFVVLTIFTVTIIAYTFWKTVVVHDFETRSDIPTRE